MYLASAMEALAGCGPILLLAFPLLVGPAAVYFIRKSNRQNARQLTPRPAAAEEKSLQNVGRP